MKFNYVMVLIVCSAFTLPTKAVEVSVPGYADPWLAGMPDGTTASSGDVAPTHSPVLARISHHIN